MRVSLRKKKKKFALEEDESGPFSIIEIIEERLDEYKKEFKFFRPSMLFGCDRANVFHYLGSPKNPKQMDNRLQRILDNGTKVHELIQDNYLSYSKKYWFVKEPKVARIIDGALVRGSCDGILIRRSDMRRQGIEVKSMAHAEFESLKKAKKVHEDQARVYMELQDLPVITVIYWDKDKQFLREFHVHRSKAAWKEITKRVKYLHKLVEKFSISQSPRHLPVYNKQTCDTTFCEFVRYCKKMGAPVMYSPLKKAG